MKLYCHKRGNVKVIHEVLREEIKLNNFKQKHCKVNLMVIKEVITWKNKASKNYSLKIFKKE